MQSIKEILYFIRCDIIFIISLLIPKQKTLWVFGAWFGDKYADNPRYFFEFMIKNHPEIKCVWLTKNEYVLQLLNKKGFPVCCACSVKGILLAMRAKFCFITHNLYDITEYACGRIKIVQLRRGTPFLVPISHGEEKYPHRWPLFKRNIYRWDEAFVAASCEKVAKIYIREFNVSPDKVKVTGYPRIDSFFAPPDPCLAVFGILKKFNRDKTGIFIPHGNYTQFLKNIVQIDIKLSELNVLLLVRPYKYPPDLSGYSNLKSIYFLRDEDIETDIYPILPRTDFLITDFASVFFDYVLLDKPVIFSPLELPAKEKNFFYDYLKTIPGPASNDWQDTLKYIEKNLSDPSIYRLKRKSLSGEFNKFSDNQNCKRVFNEISSYINLKSN